MTARLLKKGREGEAKTTVANWLLTAQS